MSTEGLIPIGTIQISRETVLRQPIGSAEVGNADGKILVPRASIGLDRAAKLAVLLLHSAPGELGGPEACQDLDRHAYAPWE